MPRLMSVALTQPQVATRSKTVTRRVGWLMLKPGDHLTLCKKVQGRLKGEPLERITDVEVVSVRRERLDSITPAEVAAEGFPDMAPAEFVEFFCASHKGCQPGSEVTRIEWRYLPSGPEILVEHIRECTDAEAVIVVDGSADDEIARLVAAGWTLEERVDHVAGKRIRFVHPPVPLRPASPEGENQ